MELGETAAARSILQSAIEAMPQLPRPWANLGYVEFLTGNQDTAARCLRMALFLDGSFCPARLLLAGIERQYGDEDSPASLEGMCEAGAAHMPSRHASRAGRLYRLRESVVSDDVLPSGLLEYCEPQSYRQ